MAEKEEVCECKQAQMCFNRHLVVSWVNVCVCVLHHTFKYYGEQRSSNHQQKMMHAFRHRRKINICIPPPPPMCTILSTALSRHIQSDFLWLAKTSAGLAQPPTYMGTWWRTSGQQDTAAADRHCPVKLMGQPAVDRVPACGRPCSGPAPYCPLRYTSRTWSWSGSPCKTWGQHTQWLQKTHTHTHMNNTV